jgi:hypothetical protein
MSKVDNSETMYISLEMRLLARQEGRGEITKEEYQTKFDELEKKRSEITRQLINQELALRKVKDEEDDENRRNQKMAEELKKEKKPKVERTPKTNSRANVIVEVLQLKSVKDLATATDKVIEKLPGQKPASVKTQISAIIKLVETSKGRFAKYNWNKETFTLSVK